MLIIGFIVLITIYVYKKKESEKKQVFYSIAYSVIQNKYRIKCNDFLTYSETPLFKYMYDNNKKVTEITYDLEKLILSNYESYVKRS